MAVADVSIEFQSDAHVSLSTNLWLAVANDGPMNEREMGVRLTVGLYISNGDIDSRSTPEMDTRKMLCIITMEI